MTNPAELVDLYLRLSIDAEGKDSMDRQEADLRAWAEREGKTVRKVWKDAGKSGYKKNVRREDFEQAAKAVSSGEVGTLAVWKLDRLSRRGAGQVGLLLDDIEDAGGRLFFLKDSLDSTVPGHRMVIVVVSEQARAESKNTSVRVTSKNEANIAQGLPVPGKRRFGFKNGNREEEPEEAELVRWAYTEVLNGASIRSVAKAFGKAPARVREILANPSYAGWVVRADVKYEAHPSVARVVDRDTWLAVQDLLADDQRRTTPGPGRKHFLSGIARCECGAVMRVLSVYYKCTADPSHATIYRRDLEPYVKEKLALALFEEYEDEVEAPAPLARRLQELEEERSRWTMVASLPGADIATVTKELAKVQAEAERLSEELSRSRVATSTLELAERAREALFNMSPRDALDLSKWTAYFDGLELDERRGLVESKLEVVVAKGRGLDRVTVTPKV